MFSAALSLIIRHDFRWGRLPRNGNDFHYQQHCRRQHVYHRSGCGSALGSNQYRGHNLIGKNDGAESAFVFGSPNTSSDIVGNSSSPILSLLGPLADNSGPTYTHLPLPGSPAINAGSNDALPQDTLDTDGNGNTGEPLPLDQRGQTRIANTTVDIGAVEVTYAITSTAGAGQSAVINTSFATPLRATVTESGRPPPGHR
jgi:hypothetical protein